MLSSRPKQFESLLKDKARMDLPRGDSEKCTLRPVPATCLTSHRYLSAIPAAPTDPLYSLVTAYEADSLEDKVYLGVGAYRDENSKPWILPVVRKATGILNKDTTQDHEYLPIAGLPKFTGAAQSLVLRTDSVAINEKREVSSSFMPAPTTRRGVDPTEDEWKEIAKIMKANDLFPFFDCAYQGFATGYLSQDNFAIRYFVDQGFQLAIAQSLAKNLGLYGQRVGAFHFVTAPGADAQSTTAHVASQLSLLQRSEISIPPIFGAHIASIILNDPQLFAEWETDLLTMPGRIMKMRKCLKEELERLQTLGTWDHIVNQIGMFSFTGLTPAQVLELREKWHVYMAETGRISVARLNDRNVAYFSRAVQLSIVIGLMESITEKVTVSSTTRTDQAPISRVIRFDYGDDDYLDLAYEAYLKWRDNPRYKGIYFPADRTRQEEAPLVEARKCRIDQETVPRGHQFLDDPAQDGGESLLVCHDIIYKHLYCDCGLEGFSWSGSQGTDIERRGQKRQLLQGVSGYYKHYLCVHSSVAHIAYFDFMSETNEPQNYPKSLALLHIVETTLYLVSALVIYYFVGPNVKSPALSSAGPLLRKICYGIAIPTVLIAGVIAGHVACKTIYIRIFRGSSHLHKRSLISVGSCVGIALTLWVIAWVIAESIPSFNSLLSLISSFLCSVFSYILPAIFWLHINKGRYFSTTRKSVLTIVNLGILAIVSAMCGLGLYMSRRSLNEITTNISWSCADNS
ncbi:putative aspartate transaminase [Aspergillus affinis]|uniref:putative aspartate transaminase n=1 Tax=Aspergillus affinis TaxID=1070780 RepID=UPI0022FE9C1F|nr:putative aspartate transaminase [Aspergillus affinis]KAI9044662.1 putative aspartate transaminase [Aspergillus affinis]